MKPFLGHLYCYPLIKSKVCPNIPNEAYYKISSRLTYLNWKGIPCIEIWRVVGKYPIAVIVVIVKAIIISATLIIITTAGLIFTLLVMRIISTTKDDYKNTTICECRGHSDIPEDRNNDTTNIKCNIIGYPPTEN